MTTFKHRHHASNVQHTDMLAYSKHNECNLTQNTAVAWRQQQQWTKQTLNTSYCS